MSPTRARRPFVVVLLIATGLLLPSSAPARPDATASAGPAATAAKACKRKRGETRKHWLKRCKCNRFKARETRRQFRKRCPGAKVPKRKPAPAPVGGPVPGPTPPPPPPPIIEPVRNDAGFADIMGRSDFLRTYKPSASATHSEYYNFCATRIEPHHYEGIAYIYEARGPWRVIEGYVNGDGSKGYGQIEFVQEQANFDEEVGKVQLIRFAWPAEGRSDLAQISHPEIGVYTFARSAAAAADC